MALTLSQHYIAGATAASSFSQGSVVVASGEGLVVLVHTSDAGGTAQTITGVTCNGGATSLTSFGNSLSSGDGFGAVHRQACFYLASPPAGTQTVAASLGGSGLIDAMEVLVVAGHDTGTMIRDWQIAVGGTTAATVGLTTVSGDLCFDLSRTRNSGGWGVPTQNTPAGSQTFLDGLLAPGSASWHHDASDLLASGTSTTMAWTVVSDSAWNTQAAAVIPGAAGDILMGQACL